MGSSLKAAARELMADTPGISYTEALRRVRKDFSGSPAPSPDERAYTERRDRAFAAVDSMLVDEDAKSFMRHIGQMLMLEREMDRRGLRSRDPASVSSHTDHCPSPVTISGPCGSGRTTAALALAALIAAVRGDGTGEVKLARRAQLVGTFEGETAAKVKELFASLPYGVLILDDFDELVIHRRGEGDPFGMEAEQTIYRHIADPQNSTAVLFTGTDTWAEGKGTYRHLRLSMPDAAHTVATLRSMAQRRGFQLQLPDTMPGLDGLAKHSGLRSANRIIETAAAMRATRLMMESTTPADALSDEELTTITAADLSAAVELLVSQLPDAPRRGRPRVRT